MKIVLTLCISLGVILLAIALGSVYIPPDDILNIILHKAAGLELPVSIDAASVAVVWNLRFPRVLLAFSAGAALSVSGAVMQSVLRNPLASSYTLGVSSGASLGACIVIFYGFTIPFAPFMTLPIMGFAFGLAAIILAVAAASRVDGRMENNTIILTGMVFALFINAVTTLMASMAREHMQRLTFWQMGSFSMKDWAAVLVLSPITLIGTVFITHFNRELDIMTFGEEQAKTVGVDLKRVKWILLISAAALTGSTVAFAGVIGFVDLIAPHIVRRIFGSSHRLVIAMSALFGASFMVLCDLIARTVITPSELPVGAVTALVGAPFFAYVYFAGAGRKRKCARLT